jgi:2-amino-4-hydroxy-6-hydroxymethyldihydropteridine diphosphokinase
MKAYLGLGSNMGDRFRNLSEAVKHLQAVSGIRLNRASHVYETEAVGDPGQPKYLNAVVELETVLDPLNLLKVCLAIERSLGRVRKDHWESRPIDLDVLLCDDEVISTKDLMVPHPLLHEREFVLRPLADIAPDLIHPVLEEKVADLLLHIDETESRRMDDLVLAV